MKRALTVAIVVIAAGAAVAYWLSAPRSLSAADLPAHDADIANGERLFWAGGCASCHSDPDAEPSERPRLGGGLAQRTPFGTFRAPNISPDTEHGIGAWSKLDFLNAMVHGVAPD
ncbi:MAG: cytochrome C, partial [Pseudomonadota bacterium]